MSEITAGIQQHDTKEKPELTHAEVVALNITSYKDLLDEEKRLTKEMKRNKDRVTDGFNIMKKKFQPADQALNFMNKFSGGTGKPGLLSTGVDIVLDLFSKKYLFRRSGWMVTLAGTYLVRGLSQLLVQKARGKEMNDPKLKSNGQLHPLPEEIQNQ